MHSAAIGTEIRTIPAYQAGRVPRSALWSTFHAGVVVAILVLFSAQGMFSFETGKHTSGSEEFGALSGAGQSKDNVIQGQTQNLVWTSAVLLLIGTNAGSVRRAVQGNPLFVSIGAVAALSSLWSQDPALSLRRGIFLLLSTLFAHYLSSKYPPGRQLRLVEIAGLVASCSSVAMVFMFPAYGVDHMVHAGAWQGIYTHKNICAMAMLLFLATQFGHRKKAITLVRTGYICLLAATLYLTQSRSGWVVAIGLCAIMELLRKIARFKLRDRTIGYAIAACLIAMSAAVLLTNAGSLLQALGRDATLSGRTDIWNAVWNSIMQRPLLGYGYAAFWRGLQGASADIILELGWAVPHAHSGILDLWLQLGLVGVIIFAASLVFAVKDMATCLRADRPGCVDWYVATVALVIMFSVTESLLLSDQSLSWLLYVLACLGLQKTAKQMRSGGTWRERISE